MNSFNLIGANNINALRCQAIHMSGPLRRIHDINLIQAFVFAKEVFCLSDRRCSKYYRLFAKWKIIKVRLLTNRILPAAKYSRKLYGMGTKDGSKGGGSGLSSEYSWTGAGGVKSWRGIGIALGSITAGSMGVVLPVGTDMAAAKLIRQKHCKQNTIKY